jgi:aminodeoxyfutalosine synthase
MAAVNLPIEASGVCGLDKAFADVQSALTQNRPISVEQARSLYESADILAVASVADGLARRKWGGVAHYQNPLRLPLGRWCEGRCRVCDGLWGTQEVTAESLLRVAREASRAEVHLLPAPPGGSAGCDLAWHAALIRSLRQQQPDVWLAGLTPQLVEALAQQAGLELGETMNRLQQAGLDALLSADEEIYTRAGRRFVHLEPMPLERELAVHRAAHAAGVQTVGDLRYRPQDDAATVLARLEALRGLHRQTAGMTVFAPVPVELEAAPGKAAHPSGYEDLRMLAVGRLFLDNVPHIRVPWLALGLKMGEVALSFGADDVGSAALDPHVRAFAPSTSFLGLSVDVLERIIAVAGRRAALVDGSFRHLASASHAVDGN